MSDWIKKVTEPGTRACSVFYAVIGAVLAILLLTIGFWRTLFIAAFAAVGALIGAIRDKSAFAKNTVNRVFPPKDQKIGPVEGFHGETYKNEEKNSEK